MLPLPSPPLPSPLPPLPLAPRCPFPPQMWNILGLCATSQGNIRQGVAAYEQAVKLKPELKEAWLNMAQVRGERGGGRCVWVCERGCNQGHRWGARLGRNGMAGTGLCSTGGWGWGKMGGVLLSGCLAVLSLRTSPLPIWAFALLPIPLLHPFLPRRP